MKNEFTTEFFNNFNRNFSENDWNNVLLRAGFKRAGYLKYTRPLKSKGTSAQLYNYNGIWYLKNYSSSLNINQASRNSVYSPCNFITEFFFNCNYKDFYDYYKDDVTITRGTVFKSSPKNIKYEPEKIIDISKYNDIVYNDLGEIIFHISYNKFIINKNFDGNKAKNFKNIEINVNGLIELIGKYGFCFVCGHFEGTNGLLNYSKKFFKFGDLFGIDIDNNMSIEQALKIPETKNSILLYTTKSHSKEQNRFRLLFPLPKMITDIDVIESIIEKYIKIYHSDISCKNANRLWFGNTDSTIFNFVTGEIYNFKDGILQQNKKCELIEQSIVPNFYEVHILKNGKMEKYYCSVENYPTIESLKKVQMNCGKKPIKIIPVNYDFETRQYKYFGENH